jgi:hypothetical protein
MKKLLLAGVAALLLSAGAAHAVEKWEESFRRCEVTKIFPRNIEAEEKLLKAFGTNVDIFETPEGSYVDVGLNGVSVTLHLDEVLALQKSIPLLKKCEKFWQCVEDRDKGKKKHCYLPRDLR